MKRPGESSSRLYAGVLGGLLGLLAGETSRRSGGWRLIGEPPPVGAAAVDLAHGYVASRGETVPVAVARRHRGVPGVGWLLPVAIVRAGTPCLVSDTLTLADAADVPSNATESCLAYVELASRSLAGIAAHEIGRGLASYPDAVGEAEPPLSGDVAVDGVVASLWALAEAVPLTDALVLLRHTVPQEVIAAVGGVLGLHYGADAMPRRWRQRLPRAAESVALAPALMRTRASSSTAQPANGASRPESRSRLFPSVSAPTGERRLPHASDIAVHLDDHPRTDQEDCP